VFCILLTAFLVNTFNLKLLCMGVKLGRSRSERNVFDKRALRRIFGPKRDEVIGEWRKLHNEKLNDLY